MKILVTGGAGFIGSNFIRYWLEKYPKDKIVNLDKLTYAGHLSSLNDVSQLANYSFVKGDILNIKLVDNVMAETEVVVHFAAESHVDRSILAPSTFLRTNVLGTQILLEAARKYKLRRFHHISTDEVFGALPLDTKEKFNESTSYDPRSPYAASKAASDHIVRAYYHTYGLPISITNCSNNFGSYQDPEKFIPRIITNLLEGEDIKIYGDGKYVRDWLHVLDHCSAIDAVLKKGKVGDTYVIGGQVKETNNLEVAKIILEVMGLPKSRIKFVKDRAGHDRRYAVDWTRVINELGWQPKYEFEEWIKKTINWYKENPSWWKPLKRRAEKLYEKTGQK